ncbi:aminoacyl-tRNA hydrolase [Candidatus Saccharibacteria bacterium CPR2]|nr:aminoacyl-tRNA hydrolase [Candidatus Saccharibacteria bacterium CPR2]
MKLIVGLGNPGKEYEHTRHNTGFMAIDYFAKQNSLDEFKEKPKLKAAYTEQNVNNEKIIFIKPMTFMNLSGESVLAVKQFFKIENKNVLVIHDELDIPFGIVKTKFSGGSAGHNGIESIISTIGDDFYRIRVGIRNAETEKRESSDFVLSRFTKAEEENLHKVISASYKLIGNFINNDFPLEAKITV